jgi:nitroreductase/FMN reductase [NAD(P)H]
MATARQLYQDRFGLEPKFLGDSELAAPLAAILRRRSHRAFRPEKLPDDLLEALLACAQSAPSKSDLQQFSIVLVDDAEARRVVMGPAPGDEWMRTAPHVAVFCADMRRGQRITASRGRTHDNNSLDTFLNASVDAGLALGFLMAAAEASGVGCCPISLIRDRISGGHPRARIAGGRLSRRRLLLWVAFAGG